MTSAITIVQVAGTKYIRVSENCSSNGENMRYLDAIEEIISEGTILRMAGT
jgi:hypothetical protein